MQELKLTASLRQDTGKSVTHKMRSAGQIPAVVYGLTGQAQSVEITERELVRLLHSATGENLLIDLSIGKKRPEKVLIKEIQRHPVTESIIHLDLLRIDMEKPIQLQVPVKLVGSAEGVKAGGVLEFVRRELDVSCLPSNIPEFIEVDISEVGINEAIHVSDLTVEGVQLLTDLVRTIVTVVPPTVIKKAEEAEEGEEVVEGEEAAAEEGAEPEVITEKKGDEEKKE